jgi:energy-converting hydrogenase Eha subunit A
MHEARAGLGVAVVNGKIYAIGGSTKSGFASPGGKVYTYTSTAGGTQSVSINEVYDPVADTWTFKASMPTPRCSFGMAVYQDKIYCIGGETNDGYRTGVNEVYDPETDTWETKTSMPTADWALTANVVDGKIYVIGSLGANQVYDPLTDSWTTKTPIPYSGKSHGYASAVVDNKIYYVGAWSGTWENPWNHLNQIYDPETDSWSFGAPAPSNVLYPIAGSTTGVMAPTRVYVFGTTSAVDNTALDTPGFAAQAYDPENDSWTICASIPTPRINLAVVVLNDTLYAIGGDTYAALGSILPSAANEQYTPFGYGTIPPVVAVVSPENKTYNSSSVSLTFVVNKSTQWVGYSLDGWDNVTATDNTTVTGLQNGLHNLTVYANDTLGNMGASETISFSVEVPFPTTLVVTASGASVAVVGVGLLVYFKKRKH